MLDRALLPDRNVESMVAACVAAGVDWVQTRDRELEGAALLAWNDAVARGSAHAKRIVNRRIDVALACDADGVHLGFDALARDEARRLLGEPRSLGRSFHEPRAFAERGLDYGHLAPIEAPRSKPATRPSLGFGALTQAAQHGTPVLAQGGIGAGNAARAIEAGASGVAVTGAILGADDPARAARELREALDA